MTKLKKMRFGLLASIVLLVMVAIVAVGLGVRAYNSQNEAPNTVFEGDCVNCTMDKNVDAVNEADEINLGAMASPIVPYDYMDFGGVRHEYRSMSTYSASTTICTLPSPSATSTLVFASLNFDLASTSAVTVRFDQAATRYGTSTSQIGTTQTVAGSAQATIIASSSPSTSVDSEVVFAPSTFLHVWMQGELSAGHYTLTNGACKAEWIVNE